MISKWYTSRRFLIIKPEQKILTQKKHRCLRIRTLRGNPMYLAGKRLNHSAKATSYILLFFLKILTNNCILSIPLKLKGRLIVKRIDFHWIFGILFCCLRIRCWYWSLINLNLHRVRPTQKKDSLPKLFPCRGLKLEISD